MAKAKTLNYNELIEYARQHYNKGGDAIFECWDEQTFLEYVELFGPITKRKALEMFKIQYQNELDMMASW